MKSQVVSQVLNCGISPNRLVNSEAYKNFDELMKCKICFNILVKPHDCEKCGNTFCKDCINILVENNKPCPFNCNNFTIKPSSLGILSFLNNLKFYCLNNFNGCDQILNYSNVLTHDKECRFSYANCPNVKCNKLIKRQMLEYHIRKECEFSLFKCDSCECDFNRNEYIEHVENCKLIMNICELKNPIIDKSETYRDIDIDLKNLSISGFLKIILFQIAKNNSEINKKFDAIHNDIKDIKEDINKANSDSLLFIENLNNDIDLIMEKLNYIEGIKKVGDCNFRQESYGENVEKNDSKDGSTNSSSNNSVNYTNTNTNSNVWSNTTPIVTTTNKNNNAKSNIIINPNKEAKIENNKIDPLGPNIKKIAIKNNNNNNYKTLNRSPNNKSPLTKVHKLSPNPKSQIQETTESFNNRTNNIILIKTMLKNQETIQEKLNNLLNRIDKVEEFVGIESNKYTENIKSYIREEVSDVKDHITETSLSTSNIIVKKIEDKLEKN